mgnify:CR=1 FL=1
MKNSFIKITLDERNEFRARADFTLFGNDCEEVSVKIDTGCAYTSIPISKVAVVSKDTVQKWMEMDYNNPKAKKVISFGVNDSKEQRKKIKEEFAKGIYDSTAVSFIHKIKDISINGVYLGTLDLRVNYKRSGNILIGMDILKTWDIHIRRIESGETILLACPYNQINEEYLLELERTFKLGTLVSSAKVRDFIDFD